MLSSSEQHTPQVNHQSESPGEDNSDGEVAEDPEPSRDIVHNSTPQQTALRRSCAARTKGGNITTAADSLVQEITAERGEFGRSRDHKPNIELAGGLYEFSTVEFRIQRTAKFCHADVSARTGAA